MKMQSVHSAVWTVVGPCALGVAEKRKCLKNIYGRASQSTLARSITCCYRHSGRVCSICSEQESLPLLGHGKDPATITSSGCVYNCTITSSAWVSYSILWWLVFSRLRALSDFTQMSEGLCVVTITVVATPASCLISCHLCDGHWAMKITIQGCDNVACHVAPLSHQAARGNQAREFQEKRHTQLWLWVWAACSWSTSFPLAELKV